VLRSTVVARVSKLVALAVLVVLAFAVGCGVSTHHGDDGSSGGEPVPLDSLGPALTDAWCRYYVRCHIEPWLAQLPGGCAAALGPRLTNDAAAVTQAGVLAGTIRYDDAQMGRCLNSIANLDCGAATPVDAQCSSSVDGVVQNGGACEHDLECAGDAYCNARASCPGVCTRRVKDQCDSERISCPAGSYCVGFEGGGGNCYPLPAEGQSCNGYCRGGLVCDQEDGKYGVCVRRPTVALGKPCRWGVELCADGSTCAEGAGADGGEACVARAASGGPCLRAVPDMCPVGEFCDPGVYSADEPTPPGVCKAMVGEGEACNPDYTAIDCAGIATCYTGVCFHLRDNGEPCTVRDDCITGRCVDGACAAPGCGTP
jgi:hypothetical protein